LPDRFSCTVWPTTSTTSRRRLISSIVESGTGVLVGGAWRERRSA
jgi:hypothetical protein